MVVKALLFGKKKWKLREGLGAVLSPVLSREGVSSIYVPRSASSSVGTLRLLGPALRAAQRHFLPEALVDLMAGVVRLCPSVCASSHFAVLLGAYGASLSILGELWGPGRGTQEVVGTRAWDPGM